MRQAMMLEQRCINMFKAMGWETTNTMRTDFPKGANIQPDITLSSNNRVVGCVEVMLNYKKSNLLKNIERANFIQSRFKPTFFIFTNGYVFDLYLEGEYFDQLTFIPSPEDIDLLLRSKKGGN